MVPNVTEYSEAEQIFHGRISRVMGTALEMVVAGEPEASVRPVWDWLCVEAGYLDSVLDRFNPSSELSRLHASQGRTSVSMTLADMVRAAKRYHELTEGLFDVAKGGMEEVSVDEHDMVDLAGRGLDFGGMAKGYLLRLLRDRIKQCGIGSAFVDFGGSSILAVGHHPFGNCWKVGVRNPYGQGILAEVELNDSSMSTSGNTVSYGAHIIYPSSGKPFTGHKVVNVACEDALEADVLSTAFMIAGEGQRKMLRERFPEAEVRIFNDL